MFDICTMWDIYRTQLPLITALFPARAVELANALLCDLRGRGQPSDRLPDGQGRGPVLPAGQRAGPHVPGRSLPARHAVASTGTGRCATWTPTCAARYGEDYLLRGVAQPITHTLDLAFGYQCTGESGSLRRRQPAGRSSSNGLAGQWVNAFDSGDGLLLDSTYYEGGKWNYSFRVLHDMQARIDLAGGDAAVHRAAGQFFGYGADPVKQLAERPSADELAAGYALNRFEGLNNEPDMEAPWAYHYVGSAGPYGGGGARGASTTCSAWAAAGLPGNDDSGGLSSWYVWASLGLFPIAGQSLYLINAPVVRASLGLPSPTTSL